MLENWVFCHIGVLSYNERIVYLKKICSVLKIVRFCVFDELTNFKICDVIIEIAAR